MYRRQVNKVSISHMASGPILSDAQRLVLRHAAPATRRRLAAVFALDARLAQIVRSTREPMLGRIRLTWWRDALAGLDETGRVPDEPVLLEVAAAGLPGAALAGMAEGWTILLDEDFAEVNQLDAYARLRGGTMFAVVGGETGAVEAGAGWALADLAAHVSNADIAVRVRKIALERLTSAFDRSWRRDERSIGLLAWLAFVELRSSLPFVRLLITLRFRLIGR